MGTLLDRSITTLRKHRQGETIVNKLKTDEQGMQYEDLIRLADSLVHVFRKDIERRYDTNPSSQIFNTAVELVCSCIDKLRQLKDQNIELMQEITARDENLAIQTEKSRVMNDFVAVSRKKKNDMEIQLTELTGQRDFMKQ